MNRLYEFEAALQELSELISSRLGGNVRIHIMNQENARIQIR